MKKAEQFKIVELGTTYQLDKFRVIEGKGIQTAIQCDLEDKPDQDHVVDEIYQSITFVRGDKTDNGQTITRVDGILHEQLLAMMIEDKI